MPTRRQLLGLGGGLAAAVAIGAIVEHETGQPTSSSTAESGTPGAPKGLAIPANVLSAQDDATLASTMSMVSSLGCPWLRTDAFWAWLEPTQGHAQWSTLDRLVGAAEKAGLKLALVVHTMPDWARPKGTPVTTGPATDATCTAYADFCGRAAAHFKGKVHAWEIWNEPNLVAFWSPSPNAARCAQLARESAAAIHAADPGALVVTGGLGGPTQHRDVEQMTFLTDMLDAGSVTGVDAVGLHPYTNLDGQADGALALAVPMRRLLDARGLRTTQLWGTETGVPTAGATGLALSPSLQSKLVDTSYAFWRSRVHDAGPLFWYTLFDSTDAERYGHFGLIDLQHHPKPALDRFKSV